MSYKKWLIGFATADAMGVPVEGYKSEKLKNDPVKNMRGFGSWNQPAGTWSDDTSLTITTMESIARLKKIDYNDIMNNFVKWYDKGEFTADGLFDVGITTRRGIINFKNGVPATESGPDGEYDNGNGSLMRIMPVAMYLHSIYGNNFNADAMDVIHNVSSLTHGHAISTMACGIYCLIAAELLEGKSIKESITTGLSKGKAYYEKDEDFKMHMKHFIRLYDDNFAQLPEKDIMSGGYVIESIEAAIWCLLNTNDFKSLILKAVNRGHDTDTTAAISAGLGGLAYNVEDLPKEWINTLRKKEYLESIEENFYDSINSLVNKTRSSHNE